MARLSDEQVEQIIRDGMPGYTLVSRGGQGRPPGPPPQTDQIAADISELRERYLDESPADAAAQAPQLDDAEEADEEIVTVAPVGGPDALATGPGPKKVIVSAREGRIVGSQG